MKIFTPPPIATRAAKAAACLWLALSLICLRQLSRVPVYVKFDLATEMKRVHWWLWGGGLGLLSTTEESVLASPLAGGPVPVVDIPFIEGSWDEVKAALGGRADHPLVVIRGFSRGTALDEFRTMEGFVANTNNTEHFFQSVHLGECLGNTRTKMPLHDAIRRMEGGERLYGGFIMNLMQNNHRLRDAVAGALGRLAEVPSLKAYSDATAEEATDTVHHSFVYHGNWHWAMLHNAPIPDAFLQVANRKRWYFTLPDYVPHMRPVCLGGAGCRFMMDPREQNNVPFREVVVGPGDLLLFPTYWPHAVANLDDEFGMGIGVRPWSLRQDVKKLLSPSKISRGSYWPTANFLLRMVAMKLGKVGIGGVPNSVDSSFKMNDPRLEAIAKELSDKLGLNPPSSAGGGCEGECFGPPESSAMDSEGGSEL